MPRFLSLWQAVVTAVAVILAAAPAAMADLSFVITETKNGGSANAPPLPTSGPGPVSFSGYTLTNYTVTNTPYPNSNSSGEKLEFKGTLAATSSTGTGSAAPTGQFDYDFKMTDFVGPTGQHGTLDVFGSFDASDLGTPNNPTSTVLDIAGTVTFNRSGKATVTATPSDSEGVVSFNPSDARFTAAAPEPAGILAGLMGLPCVGWVLAVARRRLTAVVA